MRTPAYEQGRIVYDPEGTGLSEHGVHHFHGLVLDAYRRLVEPELRTAPASLASAQEGVVPDPVIITCAPTGGVHTPTMSPHLPIPPAEIAQASAPGRTTSSSQAAPRW